MTTNLLRYSLTTLIKRLKVNGLRIFGKISFLFAPNFGLTPHKFRVSLWGNLQFKKLATLAASSNRPGKKFYTTIDILPLYPYTYFRDRVALVSIDCKWLPCDYKGKIETFIAYLQSKRQRSNNEEDSLLPRGHRVGSNYEWARTTWGGSGIDGKPGF